jgi:hypothetical protein
MVGALSENLDRPDRQRNPDRKLRRIAAGNFRRVPRFGCRTAGCRGALILIAFGLFLFGSARGQRDEDQLSRLVTLRLKFRFGAGILIFALKLKKCSRAAPPSRLPNGTQI